VTGPLTGWLEAGSRWEGDLDIEGPVRIAGTFIGTLTGGDLIEVADGGVVIGTITAPQLLLAGKVDGTARASERITVLHTAQIRGALETPWLDVRPGAQWVGPARIWHEETE
jgi:cytoskeletal protein CcmA (bactofilin family)